MQSQIYMYNQFEKTIGLIVASLLKVLFKVNFGGNLVKETYACEVLQLKINFNISKKSLM